MIGFCGQNFDRIIDSDSFFYISLCTECSSGFYGLGCKTACPGHCKNDESCNHINGTCESGCKDGWTGVTCAEGNI